MSLLRRRMLLSRVRGGGENWSFPQGVTAFFPFTENRADTVGGLVWSNLDGNPPIATGVGKWGSGALSLKSGALRLAYSEALIGDVPYTEDTKYSLEFWFYPLMYFNTSDGLLFGTAFSGSTTNAGFDIVYNGPQQCIRFICKTPTGRMVHSTESGSALLNTWHHVSLNINGPEYVLYLDGAKVIHWNSIINQGRTMAVIGRYTSDDSSSTSYFGGYINDLMVVQGLITRNGDFTPPTEPYT